MSDTPRTDAVMVDWIRDREDALEELARQLERLLREARTQRLNLTDMQAPEKAVSLWGRIDEALEILEPK
jgi:hypothetical protein